ncbi:hypothetical protein NXS19_005989 [Fusarium pseudograminearum]|nr:hypothetical protein NXS19_005989 [Fusarium pseudograminearum]
MVSDEARYGECLTDHPPGHDSVQPRARKKRIPTSCGSCRQSKVKCDGSRPCSRCQQLQKTCNFIEKPKEPHELRIEALEKEIESLRARLPSDAPNTARPFTNYVPNTERPLQFAPPATFNPPSETFNPQQTSTTHMHQAFHLSWQSQPVQAPQKPHHISQDLPNAPDHLSKLRPRLLLISSAMMT